MLLMIAKYKYLLSFVVGYRQLPKLNGWNKRRSWYVSSRCMDVVLNEMKIGTLKNIEEINYRAKVELDKVLTKKSYILVKSEYHKEVFGSRFFVWINYDRKHCYRLIWDGKDSWFILQESPYVRNSKEVTWTEISVVSVDLNIEDEEYRQKIISSIANEVE